MDKRLIILLVILCLFVGALYVWHSDAPVAGTTQGDLAVACNPAAAVPVIVGNQLATLVMGTSSRRAYALIEQPINATNTVTVAFSSSTPAAVGNGMQLTAATTSSPVASIAFGLNTDFPYTGQVSVITNAGTTTVLITTCNY